MIRYANELPRVVKQNAKGGRGTIESSGLLHVEEFCGKGRLFSHSRLKPGASLGIHLHEKDFEVYYILRGQGMYCDNGTLHPVGPGDVAICLDGQSHGLENTGSEDLEIISLILFSEIQNS